MKHLEKFNNLINEDLGRYNLNIGETYEGFYVFSKYFHFRGH